ncbi:MAG: nucleoporin NDC1 [Chloroflexi bacterium]|nr:nucleoporin NDC1 [Chloroflexota bacterium]
MMDIETRTTIDDIYSTDKDTQNKAYYTVMELTEKPVDWAYEVWDKLVDGLKDKDNHVRAIAAQVLCNLAKSDPDKRIIKDFPKLLEVTKDERFVTARHCLQSLWKVGVAGKEQQETYMAGLEKRFDECVNEKNWTLIRSDIMQSMRNVYDAVKDERIKERSLALMAIETDGRQTRKYASVWKKK